MIWPKKVEHCKHKKLLSDIKMGKEILMSGDLQIGKKNFYHHKSPISLKDVDIEKVLVSNNISSKQNYKYFNGY